MRVSRSLARICALHNPGQLGCHLAFAKEPSEYLEFLAGSH
jgi:hypothetical protein